MAIFTGGENSLRLLAIRNSTRMCDFVRFREVSEITNRQGLYSLGEFHDFESILKGSIN